MDYIEFESVKIIGKTDKAVLIKFLDDDDKDEIWIPWSVIEDNDEDFIKGYEGKMYIAEWWLQSEGLV